MKNLPLAVIIGILIITSSCNHDQSDWIRINQLGYRPGDVKVAVYISKKSVKLKSFRIIDAATGKVVTTIGNLTRTVPLDQFVSCYSN